MTYNEDSTCYAYEIGQNFNHSSLFTVGTNYDDKRFITFCNGIDNDLSEAKASAQLLSDLGGGHQVIGLHNATQGWLFDLVECGLGTCGIETPPVKMLRELWESLPPDASILHANHSQGGIHTVNASSGCDPSLLKRIHSFGVAPAKIPDRNTFGKSMNIASTHDIVPLIDFIRNPLRNREPLTLLTPHPEASWFDHSFDSPTFRESIGFAITEHLNN